MEPTDAEQGKLHLRGGDDRRFTELLGPLVFEQPGQAWLDRAIELARESPAIRRRLGAILRASPILRAKVHELWIVVRESASEDRL